MSKVKRIPDNETFHWFNANPKGRRTGDCVVRAISKFLCFSWERTYQELVDWGIEHATAMDCPETYEKFLLSLGWEKEAQPRKEDGKKYTASEFCKQIAKPGYVYILSLANHLTYIGPDNRIWDIWDCGEKCVGNFWSRPI